MRRAAVLLALFLVVSTPALALIQPRLLDWQARLAHILPRGVQTWAAERAGELPVTATPADLQAVLKPLPGIPPEAVELFAGIRLLQRRDEVLERFDDRVDLLDRSVEALEDYVRDVNYCLRNAPPGPEGPPPAPPEPGLPKPEVTDRGTFVLRLLPRPSPTMAGSRLRMLLAAARADLAEVQERQEKANEARAGFLQATLAWRWHLRNLSEGLDPSTGKPLPKAPAGLQNCPHPPVEAIPAPPPADLPRLAEPEETKGL